MGRLQWFSSDTSGGGACVKAEIEAVANDSTPEANLIFKTHTSSATSPTERMRIIGDGLIYHLDANDKTSYRGGGTEWRDLVGTNHGALTNSPTFNSSGYFL